MYLRLPLYYKDCSILHGSLSVFRNGSNLIRLFLWEDHSQNPRVNGMPEGQTYGSSTLWETAVVLRQMMLTAEADQGQGNGAEC